MRWRGAGHLDPSATTLRKQYVWSARYIDAPVLRDRDVAGRDDPREASMKDNMLTNPRKNRMVSPDVQIQRNI